MPVSCPICGSEQVEAVSDEVVVRPTVQGESPIGGLLGYQCALGKHTFFVRTVDVNADED